MNCKVKTKQNLRSHGKTSSKEIENTEIDIIYSVGTDRTLNFKEIIANIHGDNSEVMTAVKELEEFLSRPDPTQYAAATELRNKIENILSSSSDKKQQMDDKKMVGQFYKLLRFENRSEVRKFTSTINRRIYNWYMSEEIASELINEGYIIALKKLGYKNAPKNIAFSKDYAKKHGITFAEAFMFGLGGSARIAFFEWLIEKNLHGMHRPGKGPGSAFSEETKKIWYLAEYKHQPWPHIEDADGEIYLAEIPDKRGKLPQGVEELMRDSWRRYLRNGRDYAYTGMRPLRCGQNYQMIEDMVCALLEDEGRPKMYRSPLSGSQQLRYDRIIENANQKSVDPFYAVYSEMFRNPDNLKPIWDKARRILYDYSGVIRQSAIESGLIEKPDSLGITWRNRKKSWQAQIVSKGRQKYLGLFKNKADAQAAYYDAAAEMGHIPGLPDIDKIWPTWEQEKARLALMDEHPRMPVIYQQQDTHEERKFGLRAPKYLRDFVERMAKIDWLVKHCILAFDNNCPVASREVTIESRGANWYAEIKKQGKRPVICGSTSIDRETGRIQIIRSHPKTLRSRITIQPS